MVTDDNRVVLVMLPEKEGVAIPTEAELAQAMQEVNGEEIEAFVDEVKAEPLEEVKGLRPGMSVIMDME